MELSFKLGFEQLLHLVKQLSIHDKKKLANALETELQKDNSTIDLHQLLLHGPTWSKKEYNEFLKRKKQVNKFPAL